MKYLKFLAIALVALGFAACSSDDKPEYNTNSAVTVGMAQADITFSENKGLVRVPFKLEGKANGYVTVTCTVSELKGQPGIDPAMDNVHYLMTSQTVNVDTLDTEGYFEIRLIDDADENEKRGFVVRLASAEGAKIAGIQETIVYIKDNDSDPYARLGGEWFVPLNDGTVRSVMFETYDEGEDGYYSYYTVTGLVEDAGVKANFKYNEATQTGEIVIAYGQELPEYSHSSYGIGLGYLGFLPGDGYLYLDGEAVFTWNEDFTELSLVEWAGQDDATFPGADFAYLLHFDAGWMIYDEAEGVQNMYRTHP